MRRADAPTAGVIPPVRVTIAANMLSERAVFAAEAGEPGLSPRMRQSMISPGERTGPVIRPALMLPGIARNEPRMPHAKDA